ncbi:hypothetical protein GMMP15_1530032 [Candidatus Magnetomoraceae bacterium gMMP-15]
MSQNYHQMQSDLVVPTLISLCPGADFTTEKVEQLLSSNICAFIKASFGFKPSKVHLYSESRFSNWRKYMRWKKNL